MDVTFDQYSTHDESSVAAKSEQKAEGVAPVVIRQLLSCEDSQFQMWGMTFGMVTTVAIVRTIETASTKITYLLEDHTGQIEAHYWVEEGDISKSPDVMINNYVRVYGSIRKYAGKKTLMIFKMIPVSSYDTVITHLLEVLNIRYKAEKCSKKDFAESSTVGGAPAQDSENNLGLSGKQFAVYQAIKSESRNGDVSITQLQNKFNHISKQELESIVDFLAQEGHIYASLDSNHYLCTDL